MSPTRMLNFIYMLAGGYALLLAVLYFYQRNLLYHPDTSPPRITASGLPEMNPVKAHSSDGLELLSWYARAKAGMATIVYLHGNAGNIGDRGKKVRPFLDAGFGVLLVGYRGYGTNPGQPSEEGLYSDVRAALEYLETQGLKTSDIVLYGESLGSGLAVKIAAERAASGPVAALILEAPFSSVTDAASYYYPYVPIRWLLKDHFDSAARIADVMTPVFILHGEQDKTMPIKFGKRLFEVATEPKQAAWLPKAGHNDLFDYGADTMVIEFLKTKLGITP